LKLKIYFERVPHLIEPKSERRLAINIVLAKPSSNRKRQVNWDFTARQLPERPKRARVTSDKVSFRLFRMEQTAAPA